MGNVIKSFVLLGLVNLRLFRIALNYRRTFYSLAKKMTHVHLSKSDVKIYKNRWRNLLFLTPDINWLKVYRSKTGNNSLDFVAEDIYYCVIEPILNNNSFSTTYSDKNFYNLIYPSDLLPNSILRCIDGHFFNSKYDRVIFNQDLDLENYICQFDQVIVKPSLQSGGGFRVELFICESGSYFSKSGIKLSLNFLEIYYGNNFVIQEVIEQHPFLSNFNESSLNTIRILSYFSPVTSTISILHIVLRVGSIGQFVDNSRAGGYSIGVSKNGVLNNFAFKKGGERFEKVNSVSLSDCKYVIPFIEQLKAVALNVAKKNIHHRLLGLDLTIDINNKIRCIEVNNTGNEINFYQYNNGPLFGEFTNEVIEYCLKKKHLLYSNYTLQNLSNLN